ncbi:YdeI/OmpD-associated family protein [Litorisediminicola beolgyonensis]|uniref:YdeI family protein n=1 Tax=Litorisediminicola beolgyonensis TaxID=1173614 RepID=A0ABW3ZMX0_9RHOB
MGGADPRIDRYLAKERPWRAELQAFRALLLSEGLTEALKWRAPCFMAHDRNVAILGGYSSGARMTFFKGVLLEDPDDLLHAPGPNSRFGRYVHATSAEEIARQEDAFRALIRQAVEIARRGDTVDPPPVELDLPQELIDALDGDDALRDAWEVLTPGRRRGYVLYFSGAKQSATRAARVERHRDAILAGRGLHDR